MRKKLFAIFKVILIVYCLVGIGLYYLQEKFLLHPEPVPGDHQYPFKGKFEDAFIRINDQEKIHVVKFFSDTPSRGLILYFHGNMKNVGYYEKNAAFFTGLGFDVWMPDYQGFGKSTGTLTEAGLYQLARQVRKMAGSRYPPDRITIYGKSLGTGIASYLAANSTNRMLVLETPYSSIPSLFSQYAPIYPTGRMSKFNLPSIDFLKEVQEPILIFHGDGDRTIPLKEASKLKGVLKPTDRFVEIKGGKHNNLGRSPEYQKTLQEWLMQK